MASASNLLQEFKLCIKETENKGKGLFTLRAIKKGDVILIEKPLVACQFSWNKEYSFTACENCLKSLETAQNMARRLTLNYDLELPHHEECCDMSKQRRLIFKCPRCQEQYCCEECFLDAEEKYHRVLCLGNDRTNIEHPINKLEETWKKIHYPPETATVMFILKMIAMIEQSSHPEDLLIQYDQFFSMVRDNTQKMAHKLLGEKFKEQLDVLHKLLKNAISSNKFDRIKTVEDLKSLFGLIGMNGQGIGTSSLSIYVYNIDAMNSMVEEEEQETTDAFIDKVYDEIAEVSGQFLNCEGSGLYSFQSRANHNCEPNSEVTFPYNSSTLVLVALNDIDVNEEICICYLDECQRSRSRHSRRKILRENYLFECTCSRCELKIGEISEMSETSSEEEDDYDDMSEEEN